jgi:hypothetical protein
MGQEEWITTDINERGIQGVWKFDSDVRAIAVNQGILDFLGELYGCGAFPFQTLNFSVDMQQEAHTDMVHSPACPNSSCAACGWRWRISARMRGGCSTCRGRSLALAEQ